jgi:hypothetical protein
MSGEMDAIAANKKSGPALVARPLIDRMEEES